jgi:putative protease
VKRKIELLAPGGEVDSIKAAILAGANAVYCGLNKFNARNRATNISFDDLQGIIRLAHKNSCEVFLTLNILVVESEIPALISLLNKLVNTNIDGVIVQDLGLFYILSTYFKTLKIHASTQLTTHNKGQIQFLNKLHATRVNLSRELNIREIKSLTTIGHQNHILSEVFVHGSYCLSYSGLCYMSSVHGGKSGNRGRCSQPCRDKYLTTKAGKSYPLNLKDNSAYFNLKELYDAGVDSLKIEGRIKEFEYVYTVVNSWKKQIDSFYNNNSLINDNSDLHKVFNRDFSNSFLTGEIDRDMFIDNPMSNSIKHLSDINNYSSEEERMKGQVELDKEKRATRAFVKNGIKQFNIEKAPLNITVSGESGKPLQIAVNTPEYSFEVLSEINLAGVGKEALTHKMLLKRLKSLNETEYYIQQLDLENLKDDLFLPFKELTSMKRKLLFVLMGSKAFVDPIPTPVLNKQNNEIIRPTLSVLIASQNDINICDESAAGLYFQLPNGLKNKLDELVTLFTKNKKLVPWFPSVILGEDYLAAIDFIQRVQPKSLVTNNTGIAYEAYANGIPWIAGPHLNTINSYSLLSLKENFNCSGAFLSNEISKGQMINIKKPAGFQLHYSIYHPIALMTSRQCLFHQVTGCTKNKIDETCISECDKTANITNLENVSFFIEKTKGNLHHIYNDTNLLNTDIVSDFPNTFSSFLVDLRDVKTKTNIETDKSKIISLFEKYIGGNPDSKEEIKQLIRPTTNTQYKKGI